MGSGAIFLAGMSYQKYMQNGNGGIFIACIIEILVGLFFLITAIGKVSS